jgi:hypothetical protein
MNHLESVEVFEIVSAIMKKLFLPKKSLKEAVLLNILRL